MKHANVTLCYPMLADNVNIIDYVYFLVIILHITEYYDWLLLDETIGNVLSKAQCQMTTF